jgi:hypothetical protein
MCTLQMKELESEGSSCNGIHIVAHSMGNYVTHYASESPHRTVSAWLHFSAAVTHIFPVLHL